MYVDAVAALQRNLPRVFAAALLAAVCVVTRPGSAAECGPDCDLDVKTRVYSDPRCVPRPIVPKDRSNPFPAFEREGPHCDLRPRRRQAHHAPSVTPRGASPSAPLVRPAPVAGTRVPGGGGNQAGAGASEPGTGTSDPGRQPARSTIERDVGFGDAFVRGATPDPGFGRGVGAETPRGFGAAKRAP